ncbi:MAG: flagellar biosynthesis protein FlhB [Clostridiales bacterium]|jgi:flagellar biosynthetic protein FlhB|nr:flagellar biosynthesis protein FlhB [Clostridiales bacterium]
MSPQQTASGERTERATPKKRRDARREGQVFKSNDLVVALSMAVLLGALKLFGPGMVENIIGILTSGFTRVPDSTSIASIMNVATEMIVRFVLTMLPLFLTAMVAGALFSILQVGFLFTPNALRPKFSRINPIEGFKRLFSKQTLVELLKSIIKIAVLVWVAYGEYQTEIQKSLGMMHNYLFSSVGAVIDMIFAIGFKLVVALVIMAPFDLLFQWWKFEKDLRMTKQEVKDEYKLTEGDPQIKSRIKQKQREMSAMRMMQAVGGADVVITNPTHYAVALSYKEDQHAAPLVVAKGKDFLAQRIKEEADRCGVIKVENVELARALYFFCDVGDEVPEELYQAVAEVLAYIYKLRHGGRRRREAR